MWDIGTDIGGTFTDIIAVNSESSETRIAKVPSRPDAPVRAMLEALDAVGVKAGEVRRFVHGTTRITNALVEERLPRVALITTAGFEDVLEIGRYRRQELYRLDVPPKAPPLVPHQLCFGIKERVDFTGAVLETLGDSEIDRLIGWLKANKVDSAAISLLHSYANPDHEKRIAEKIKSHVAHVCASHEINPESREFERASSTVFNAAAMPIAVEYLTELEKKLPLGPGLQVFHSAGAMVSLPAVKRRPVVMAMSGPAAGVAASARIARDLDKPRILTFDMGGTTTDVCLIVDGVAEMTDTRMIGGRPLRQPMLAVHSIGAGGGSIVKLGPGGLTVGPQSAGAVPGPVCYGRGGTEPTITDANVVLGYLDPAVKLGDAISVDIEAAKRALAPIADALGLSVIATALGVVRVANAAMARALRRVTVERGIDGRECVLLAFGGGGPMHATGLAETYGLNEIIVPAASSAFSALGCLTADFSFLQQQTVRMGLDGLSIDVFAERAQSLIHEARGPLLANGIAEKDIVVETVALMRYAAQNDSMPVSFTLPLDIERLREDFNRLHRERYGYATAEPCVIESLRVQAAKSSSVAFSKLQTGRPSAARRERSCVFGNGETMTTTILPRESLSGAVEGPAIIEDAWSTVVVSPGWRATPDALGNLFLSRISA
ncbi:acetophenone carboxylase gamma subunit [Variibacter gotjawalensis]|uniref:Acetophenone carboxylase gamma subunit n=1 Tax=Variibacter gotjawalensis TaxID=1333996 RepID=A0A0S3PZV4_9BRAD|nr:hydantoinase/oxoprolinase family protein [Variibacter gotjawalensis]NIK47302.1 N-methylhydantoinase A [Variibacter gotjawalensis]RZS49201.1 N-methylhydantoinase A [Variibacter gotjawalensis]BAT61463.1 acetophenone carboxylase gamma subunit [Variibacter gotjawalensis]